MISVANGGIGFELANQLLTDSSKYVLLGSRSIEKGEAAVKELKSKSLPGGLELLQIDVDDEESVAKAAKQVESRHGRYRSPLSSDMAVLTTLSLTYWFLSS